MSPARQSIPMSLCQTIPSTLAEAEMLCKKIRALLETACLSKSCFAVELLARECLVNAVVHGNRKAADKSVDLRLVIGRKWIRLTVSDEGAGFAWQRARRIGWCTSKASGRGLQLYGLYAERIQFNRSGTHIALWIRKTK